MKSQIEEDKVKFEKALKDLESEQRRIIELSIRNEELGEEVQGLKEELEESKEILTLEKEGKRLVIDELKVI